MLLEAAAATFAARGFAQTTTRMIADEAGVSETLLYRHFGSKAALFDRTVTGRFRLTVEEFAQRWACPPSGAVEDRAHEVLLDLVRFLRAHRDVVLVLMTVDAFEPGGEGVTESLRATTDRLLAVVRECVLTDREGHPLPGTDEELTAPGVLALLLGVAVLDDLVFADATHRPPPVSVEEEALAMVLYGVAHRRLRGRGPSTSSNLD
ncbi:TetR/AcrR family transcriptional regulator [Actinomycetospora chibensis]|uniref:TetR/AcrR family transcriptional regulator n=1 Tax=Actinomycetospora chibensis TaxID=663606 RepID=A0ABV9RCZ8_9PSEU|nr:TetR/AcrR family transcriptional regulator [Actinomycetospora chibensis]MDD7925083.1 helix-turn-helix domain containing protein [Actinomycetospora chibensis]